MSRITRIGVDLAKYLIQVHAVDASGKAVTIGPVTASALVATVGDFKQFITAAQFGAWLGLTPKQNSSAGKTSLASITKRGSNYLRSLLIMGAKAAVLVSKNNDDPISQWAQRLRERSGWQKAVVALANKNARILWAVMTGGKRYDAHHGARNGRLHNKKTMRKKPWLGY